MKNELELKHIAGYLLYGLKMIFPESGDIRELTGLSIYIKELRFHFGVINRGQTIWKYKPILRPLSDLNKYIAKIAGSDEQYQDDIILYIDGVHAIYMTMEKCEQVNKFLYEHHFDIHNLIPRNLAVDANSLEP